MRMKSIIIFLLFCYLAFEGKQQYISNDIIVEGNLYTGIFYKIKSRWGTILVSNGEVGENNAGLEKDNDQNIYLPGTWVLLPSNRANFYRIKNVNKLLLDDWGGKMSEDSASTYHDYNGDNQIWEITKVDGKIVFASDPDRWFKIKSYNKVVLDSWGGKVGQKAASVQEDAFPNENQIWRFVPTGFSTNLEISNFEYESNARDLILQKQKMELVDEQRIQIDNNTIGSSVSRTFTKSVTNTFSWGLNEKIGFSSTVSLKFGLMVEASLSYTLNVEFSANQQWTSSKTNEISSSATLIPNCAGNFSAIGWVNLAENVVLPFKAKATVTARGYRVKSDGSFDENAQYNNLSLFKVLDFSNLQNLLSTTYDVYFKVSGTLKGSFGLTASTTFKTI